MDAEGGFYSFQIDGDQQASRSVTDLGDCWGGHGIVAAEWQNEMLDPGDQNGGTSSDKQLFEVRFHTSGGGWNQPRFTVGDSCGAKLQPGWLGLQGVGRGRFELQQPVALLGPEAALMLTRLLCLVTASFVAVACTGARRADVSPGPSLGPTIAPASPSVRLSTLEATPATPTARASLPVDPSMEAVSRSSPQPAAQRALEACGFNDFQQRPLSMVAGMGKAPSGYAARDYAQRSLLEVVEATRFQRALRGGLRGATRDSLHLSLIHI